MRKFITMIALIALSFNVKAQEEPPAFDTNFKPISPNNFYIHLPDSAIWQYKGTVLGWQRLARYKDLTDVQDKTVEVLGSLTLMGSYTGTAKSIIVPDASRGGTFDLITGALTADGGITFEATGKGAGKYWVRKYNKASPVDMSWYGVNSGNSTVVNAGIINSYLTAHPYAYISVSSDVIAYSEFNITNNARIYDPAKQAEVIGGQYFGRAIGGGGFHALMRGISPADGAGRFHIEPSYNMPLGSTTSKIDLMGDPYDNDIINYRILGGYWNNYNVNGNSGIGFWGVKGTGSYFGKFPAFHFGFNDNTVVPMKLQYYDYTDTVWHTPFLGRWMSGLTVTSGDYVTASNHLYKATSSGVSGNTIPSHSSSTVSDGTVNWLFIKDYSGAQSANFKPSVIFGDLTDKGLTNIPLAIRVQFHGDAIFKHGKYLRYADNTNLTRWKTGIDANTTAYKIISNTGGYLRFEDSGQFVQNIGLSWLVSEKAVSGNSVTPDISNTEHVIFNNSSATSVTSFSNAKPNQRFTVTAVNGNTTLVNSASIRLQGGVNRVVPTDLILQFMINSTGTVATQIGN